MQRLLASRPIFSPIVSRSFLQSIFKPPPRPPLRTMALTAQDSDWQRTTTASAPSYNVYLKSIRKSENDDRTYRIIRLDNGLEAMIIQDATADKAAASLDVAVGHLHDPDDMPGLAHFCEHLLFMGTEQYPKENEYSEFLAKNNGYSNAFTGTSNTNYYFTVSTQALPGALSRFAAFFHSPLFDPSCTTRELNAVDSEHKKNHQNDMWRIFQLNKHLSKEGHPWRKFGSGNKDSLTAVGRKLKAKGLLNGTIKPADGSLTPTPEVSRTPSPASSSESEDDGGIVGRETRRRLVEWWKHHYDANRMRLCIIGKESVEELSDLASKLFSPIPNKNLDPLPTFTEHPFGPNEMGTLVSVQTVMAFHAIEISFPIPYQPPYWRRQPANFLSHFVGHEGPGSLHSYLKHKGWISALSSGSQTLARGIGMFKVTLRLTKEGFDNHKEITLAVYKYLSLLRTSEFPPWYQHEIRRIRDIQFQFAEKRRPEDYALWVADHLGWPVPRELVITAPRLVEDWDSDDPKKPGEGEKEVRNLLQYLQIEKGRSVLMAKKEEHERIAGGPQEWQHEPWYGTGYTVERYDEEFIKQAEGHNDIPELFLPGPNEFIPENLRVEKREVAEPEKRPRLVLRTKLSELWHKKDDQWWVPKAQVILEIQTPVVNESPRAAIMSRLYGELVTDSLTEYSYDADLAGLGYSFSSTDLGLYLTLNGYNDKLHVLGKDILEKARTLVVNPDRLHTKKQELKRDYENYFMDQTYRISEYYSRYVMTGKRWLIEEMLDEITTITAEELQSYIARLLSRVRIHGLIVGNMYKDEAIRLIETTEQTLQSSPLPSNEYQTALYPPEGSNFVVSAPIQNPNEPNSCLSYYVHTGSMFDIRSRVTASVITQILSEPAFNVLRTKEQLGYIVWLTPTLLPGDAVRGIRVVVQSERSPAYLEQRVDAFLEDMRETIASMAEEVFQEHKKALEHKWAEKHKNMTEETNSYWPHISSGHLDFLRREENIEVLPSITKEDVVSFYDTYVRPSSPTRAKLSVHVKSKKPRPPKMSLPTVDALIELTTAQGIALDSQFKDGLSGSSEPTVDQVTTALKNKLVAAEASPGVTEGVLAQIPIICKKYPPEIVDEGRLPENATFIEDPKAVRAELRQTEPPKPFREWGDLPISRL